MNTLHVAIGSCMSLVVAAAGATIGCASDSPASSPPPVIDSGAVDPPDAGEPDADAGRPFVDAGPPCSETGWCRTDLPGYPAPNLKAVFSSSKNRALAAGETCERQGSQYVCKTILFLWNGSKWNTLARGLDRLTAIWASDDDHYWTINEQTRSLYRLTLSGDRTDIVPEALPDAFAGCGEVKLAISGTSDTNIYVAAYCYMPDQTTKGLLFHRGPGEGGGPPTWTTVWSAGGSSELQAALGAIHVTSSGDAWAAGWKIHASAGTWGARYFIPDVMNTLVLHVPASGGPVEEQELDPALAMCSQSIWSAGDGSVFVGGVCDGGYLDFNEYTTLARYGQLPGGEMGWSALHRTPVGQWGAMGTSFPFLWGFAGSEVYAVGSWATTWDGSALKAVNLAVRGSPVGNRVVSVHGSSPADIWMVGNGFAVHRAQ